MSSYLFYFIIIIIIIIIISSSRVFTAVLADGFSLEFEWQQVSLRAFHTRISWLSFTGV